MDAAYSACSSFNDSARVSRNQGERNHPTPPLMQISFDKEAIRGLVREVLREAVGVIDWPTGRLALDEAEAARACGVARHVLRDLRLSGQIAGRKLGRKVVYTHGDLLAALASSKDLLTLSEGQTRDE